MISFQQMTYILALYEERHFVRASDKCFVTQPTLSLQIKKAEEALGHLIFDRNKVPVEPTIFGENLIPIIRELLNQSDRISKLSNQFSGLKREHIKIGVIPTISNYLIPRIFSSLNNVLEEGSLEFIELKTEDLIKQIEEFSLDIIIMAGPYFDLKFNTIKLFEEEIYIYCPTLKGNHIEIEDIKNLQPWLLSQGNCLRNQMIEFCQLINRTNETIRSYQGGNFEVLTRLVDSAGGYTLIPEFASKNLKSSEGLKKLKKNGLFPGREIIAVYSNRSIKEELIKSIISIIKSEFVSSQSKKLEIIDWK